MYYRQFPLLAILLVICVSGCTRDVHETAEESKRNIVLIVADDHSQDLGAYGNPVIQTPNLDRLAAEGTIFQQHYDNG